MLYNQTANRTIDRPTERQRSWIIRRWMQGFGWTAVAAAASLIIADVRGCVFFDELDIDQTANETGAVDSPKINMAVVCAHKLDRCFTEWKLCRCVTQAVQSYPYHRLNFETFAPCSHLMNLYRYSTVPWILSFLLFDISTSLEH